MPAGDSHKGQNAVGMQRDLSGCTLDSQRFKLFWLNFSGSLLTLGTNLAGCGTLVQLQAPTTQGPVYIGLLSWDTSVAFRNVLVSSPLRCLAAPGQLEPRQDSLLARALARLPLALTERNVCHVLTRMHQMWGAAVPQWAVCVRYLAEHLRNILAVDPEGFLLLPQVALGQVLSFAGVAMSEHSLFLALESWAFGRVLPAETEALQAELCTLQPLKATCCTNELDSMLQHVRFPLMTPVQLDRAHCSPLASVGPMLRELVREAHNAACRTVACNRTEGSQENIPQNGLSSAHNVSGGPCKRQQLYTQDELRGLWRLQPRCPPSTAELLYWQDGDHRGVMHFIGTDYAQSIQFVNPHLTDRVVVSSSSPFHPDSKPSHLTSQEYHRAACALPDAGGSAFWAVHFNGGHKLACRHYTMRANGSKSLPRTWELQGCCDGGSWISLHAAHGDESLSEPGVMSSWAIDNTGGLQFYTDFRVILTGPTSTGGSVLNVEYLELYGYFWYGLGHHASAEKCTG
jgi:hypothetical protein